MRVKLTPNKFKMAAFYRFDKRKFNIRILCSIPWRYYTVPRLIIYQIRPVLTAENLATIRVAYICSREIYISTSRFVYKRLINRHDLSKWGFPIRKLGHIWSTFRTVPHLCIFEVDNAFLLAAFKGSTACLNLFPNALKHSIFMPQNRQNLVHQALGNSR
jgi:hypothetical protein